MKNTTLVICILSFTFSSTYSQIKKGTFQWGGSLGYSKYNQEQVSPNQIFTSVNTFWSFLPTVGYFVAETSALGIGLGYDRFDQVWKSNDRNTFIIGQPRIIGNSENRSERSLFIVKPYYRLHKIVSENFVFFAEFNASYGFGNREQNSNSLTTELDSNGSIISQTGSNTRFKEKQNTWGLGLNPGIIFFPTKQWGIELNVGLLGYSEIIGEQSNSTSNLILQPSLNNLSVGLRYYTAR